MNPSYQDLDYEQTVSHCGVILTSGDVSQNELDPVKFLKSVLKNDPGRKYAVLGDFTFLNTKVVIVDKKAGVWKEWASRYKSAVPQHGNNDTFEKAVCDVMSQKPNLSYFLTSDENEPLYHRKEALFTMLHSRCPAVIGMFGPGGTFWNTSTASESSTFDTFESSLNCAYEKLRELEMEIQKKELKDKLRFLCSLGYLSTLSEDPTLADQSMRVGYVDE